MQGFGAYRRFQQYLSQIMVVSLLVTETRVP
jgi:hypothetical protein